METLQHGLWVTDINHEYIPLPETKVYVFQGKEFINEAMEGLAGTIHANYISFADPEQAREFSVRKARLMGIEPANNHWNGFYFGKNL